MKDRQRFYIFSSVYIYNIMVLQLLFSVECLLSIMVTNYIVSPICIS